MSTASRKWVKVWHEILTDTTFLNLSLEQQARFYHLLVYVSQHGDRGVLTIEAPARYLLTLMQCINYDELVTQIAQLPNIQITEKSHASFSVTVKGWSKYQIDSTACERQKKHRNHQMSRPKNKNKIRKEKEEDKDLNTPPISPKGGLVKVLKNQGEHLQDGEQSQRGIQPATCHKARETATTLAFENFWKSYPKRRSKGQAEKAWDKIKPDEQLQKLILKTLEWAKTSVDWTKEGGKYIPHPATWLNAKGWEDEYMPAVAPQSQMDKNLEALKRAKQLVEGKEAERKALGGG